MCSVKDRSFENDTQIKDYSTLSSIKDHSSENNSRIPDAHWAHVAFSTEKKVHSGRGRIGGASPIGGILTGGPSFAAR